MAVHTYTIASQEGVDRWGGELGDKVDVDLDVHTKRAVVAAGWLEPDDGDTESDDETETTTSKGKK